MIFYSRRKNKLSLIISCKNKPNLAHSTPTGALSALSQPKHVEHDKSILDHAQDFIDNKVNLSKIAFTA
jgi:hypothetical protein